MQALEQLRILFLSTTQPRVMVIDREIALMNSIHAVFPGTQRILCTQHIEKNVLVQASRYFTEEELRTKFMRAWAELVSSPSISLYEEC